MIGGTLKQWLNFNKNNIFELDNLMSRLLSLVEKWQSYYENNSKNYYYQKNYFIFKLTHEITCLKKKCEKITQKMWPGHLCFESPTWINNPQHYVSLLYILEIKAYHLKFLLFTKRKLCYFSFSFCLSTKLILL